MSEQLCTIITCLKSALKNGYCEEHQAFAPENDNDSDGGKHLRLLLERVDRDEIMQYLRGVNGLIAITKSIIYVVRGSALERKVIKTYSIKGITSIEIKKPGLITNGHFQIISSGNNDRTKRSSSAFDYARDENTIMIRYDYEKFLELEQLIYQLRDSEENSDSFNTYNHSIDVFDKIYKLGELRENKLITDEEFEAKKKELLSKI